VDRAALGFSVHVGWAAVVAIARRGNELELVLKDKITMATTFEEGAVYHMAESLEASKAETWIETSKRKHTERAEAELEAHLAELRKENCEVVAAGIVANASKKPLPPLESILKSHALVHTAEGELYRAIIENISNDHGAPAIRIPAKELPVRATKAARYSVNELIDLLAKLGKKSGKPWTKDQKEASLAAIVALKS
jgi:hypothetical protein